MLRRVYRIVQDFNKAPSWGRALGWLLIFGGLLMLIGFVLEGRDFMSWVTGHWWVPVVGTALIVALERWAEEARDG